MKQDELYANFRHVRKIELLKVEVNEGDGTEHDPIRRVAYICTFDGKVIAKIGEDKERLFVGNDEMIKLSPEE
jgi:hypothetical protein